MLREGLTFDDVLLIPRKSRVFSRKNISTKTKLSKNIDLHTPLISANMDTVTESRMARAMAEAGGIGIIHRFCSIEKQTAEVRKVKRAENVIIEDPITVHPDQTAREVRELMNIHGVSSALVIKKYEKKLVGILTSRDMLFEDTNGRAVKDIMTKRVITAPANISIAKAQSILHQYKIEKLPLVKRNGDIAGLITLKDILKKIHNPYASKDRKGRLLVGAAVGVKDDTLPRTKALLEAGADVIVIDIAHGHNVRVLETIKILRKKFGKKIEIIAGNVATSEATLDLIKAGADGIKVGIGPGAACTTRVVTGVGVPQLTAIQDVVKAAQKYKVPIIADGGIKNSGDFSKALAAGAQTAMIGRLLAGCKESPGEYVMERGVAYKYYRGMASHEAGSDKAKLDGGKDGFSRAPEGASGKITYSGEAAMVISDLVSGLRSSMSYLGAHTLPEFSKNAEFIRITEAGLHESKPHGV
ncbi:MAG: IMP dehydrogenase [Parcubacteria group bacterium]|nr:IMP dehydrogenase [Parcubacteria group bacterium]